MLFKEFLAFLSVFPFFSKDFRGSEETENPCFFGGFPCLFPKKQGKEDQGSFPCFFGIPCFPPTVVFLVSHYSAIGDTISCDAPYSAIGFRGKFFLRCPPCWTCLWLRYAIFKERSGGIAVIVCDATGNTVRQGYCYTCLAIGGAISVGSLSEDFLVFWSVFPFISRDFRGSAGIRNPCFLVVSLAFGKDGQGVLVVISGIFLALSRKIPGRNYIRPPPLPPISGHKALSREGGWGCVFRGPPRQEFYTPPPLLYNPHP